jgi:hypothetical protein
MVMVISYNASYHTMMKMLTVKRVVSDDEQSCFWQSGAVFLSNLHIQTYVLGHKKIVIF